MGAQGWPGNTPDWLDLKKKPKSEWWAGRFSRHFYCENKAIASKKRPPRGSNHMGLHVNAELFYGFFKYVKLFRGVRGVFKSHTNKPAKLFF